VFTTKTLTFLRALKRNNRREWFHANRDRYDAEVRGPMVAVIERLADDLPTFAPDMAADVKTSLFRPWRDTRFSADKTPLKNHVAARFPHRKLGRQRGASFYFEVAPTWVWIGGGMYAPDMSQLHALREHVAANHARLDRILGASALRRFGGLHGERMTRVPRGYGKDHPAAHHLQFKQFFSFREEAAVFATEPAFYKELVATFRNLAPLVGFLNEAMLELQRTERLTYLQTMTASR
jgi:uncharacterized protein (TIGR02453 family)